MSNKITVFSKPWQEKSLEELADFVKGMGLDGVELAVRPGYQVEEENIASDLPKASRIFEDRGLGIESVACNAETEETIAALGDSGVPIFRVMAKIDMKVGYMRSVDTHRKRWDALLPALEKNGVTIGVQNHCDYDVGSAIGLVHLLRGYDPKLVGAVLDPAHCGLDGEPEDMAIDIAWPHLAMINLKNAFRRLADGLEGGDTVWQKHWTTGPYGFVSWPKIIADLKKRGYRGAYCLTAEYSSWDNSGDLTGDRVDPLIAKDAALVRSLVDE